MGIKKSLNVQEKDTIQTVAIYHNIKLILIINDNDPDNECHSMYIKIP